MDRVLGAGGFGDEGRRVMADSRVKEQARRLVDGLPDDATWEDLQYEIYVRQAIEKGLNDSREGRTVSVEEARRRFGVEGQ